MPGPVNILPNTHAFDETGTLPENYIENEQRDLATRDVRAVVATYGSFFTDTFVMRDANGVVVPRIKYQFALYNDVISSKVGKNICAAVVLLDKTVPSPVFIDYHCVGGPWSASNELIIELFKKLQSDDRPVAWPNIIGKPEGYAPAHHLQDIGDLYGAEYWVEAIERLTQAFLMGDSASHDEIFRYIDAKYADIHQEIIDLGNNLRAYIDQQDTILNGKITTVDQRVTTVRSELLTAIATVDQRLTTVQTSLTTQINGVATNLATHVADENNPHKVKAAQTGAYTKSEVDALITGVNNQLTNYVKKNAAEELSPTISSGRLYVFMNGVHRQIFPPEWQ